MSVPFLFIIEVIYLQSVGSKPPPFLHTKRLLYAKPRPLGRHRYHYHHVLLPCASPALIAGNGVIATLYTTVRGKSLRPMAAPMSPYGRYWGRCPAPRLRLMGVQGRCVVPWSHRYNYVSSFSDHSGLGRRADQRGVVIMASYALDQPNTSARL